MRREICGECDSLISDDGTCDCAELLKRGWRQCAVGELREVYAAIDDVHVDNIVTLPEAVRRLREAAVVLYEAMSDAERIRLRTEFPEQMGWIEGLLLVLKEVIGMSTKPYDQADFGENPGTADWRNLQHFLLLHSNQQGKSGC